MDDLTFVLRHSCGTSIVTVSTASSSLRVSTHGRQSQQLFRRRVRGASRIVTSVSSTSTSNTCQSFAPSMDSPASASFISPLIAAPASSFWPSRTPRMLPTPSTCYVRQTIPFRFASPTSRSWVMPHRRRVRRRVRGTQGAAPADKCYTPQSNGMVERFNGRIASDVLGINVAGHVDPRDPVDQLQPRLQRWRQRLLLGHSPMQKAEQRPR